MKLNRITTHLFLGAALFLLAGCDEKEYGLKFSHYLHVEDNGMDCGDCHGEPGTPDFNSISHQTCLDCHDEPEAEEIGPETCGMCHQEKQLPMLEDWKTGPEKPSRGIFVHTEALAGRCTDCHKGLLDENLAMVPEMTRSDVVALRDSAHDSGQDCLTCHVDMARDQAPSSHDHVWMKRHGMLGMQDNASCSVCHAEDSCMECHSIMQPASHNNLFRRQTHGTLAAWNRDSCQVCHEEDSCASCHANSRPMSHVGRWAASGMKPTHCIGCHNTSAPGDGCATCHEGGNDVLLHEKYWGGAPIDHNQPGIENCYICHWTTTP